MANQVTTLRQLLSRTRNQRGLPFFSRTQHVSSATPPLICHSGRCLCLHLCIKQPPIPIGLRYLPICRNSNYTDRQFFPDLRKWYDSNRDWKRKWFSKLKRVDFVKFDVYTTTNLVNTVEPNNLPQTTEHYDFLEVSNRPPISHELFLHILTRCDAELPNESYFLDRLPKKRGEPLVFNSADRDANIGWGLHFIEGLYAARVAVLMFISLAVLFGLVFGICWTVLKNDIQGAWGVAAWMTPSIAMVALAWQTWNIA